MTSDEVRMRGAADRIAAPPRMATIIDRAEHDGAGVAGGEEDPRTG